MSHTDLRQEKSFTTLWTSNLLGLLFLVLNGFLTLSCTREPIPSELAPDLIIHSGRIVTVDEDFSITEALAIKGETLVAVGTNDEVVQLAGERTKIIDLEGKTVIPGIIDSHMHAFQYGLRAFKQLFFETEEILTKESVLETIKERADNTPPGEWIVIRGPYSLDFMEEGRLPDRWELDPVTPDHPLYWNVHGHVGQINSYAIKLAGITSRTRDPEGGLIERRSDGEPTGLLLESSAHVLVTRLIPDYSFEEKLDAEKKAVARFASAGITSLVNTGEDRENVLVLQELWRRKELVVRWHLAYWFRPADYNGKSYDQIEAAVRNVGPAIGFGDEWLKIGGIKLSLDGGIEGAYNREPFSQEAQQVLGEGWRGMLVWDKDTFRSVLRAAAKYDARMFVHVLGDAALDIALDTMEEVDQEYSIVGKRWTLEHGGLLPTRKNLEQAKRLGLVVSTQQAMGWSIGLSFKKSWGQKRGANLFPNRTWLDAGLVVKGGSDAAPIDPMFGIWSYVTRKDLAGEVSQPEQIISREEALRLYTINGAYGTFEEDVKGSIEVGKVADLVVLSDDLLTVPEEKIKDIEVLKTIIGGKIVYERQP